MRHHDRQPDRKHTAGHERKAVREGKKIERVSETMRELERDKGAEDDE